MKEVENLNTLQKTGYVDGKEYGERVDVRYNSSLDELAQKQESERNPLLEKLIRETNIEVGQSVREVYYHNESFPDYIEYYTKGLQEALKDHPEIYVPDIFKEDAKREEEQRKM